MRFFTNIKNLKRLLWLAVPLSLLLAGIYLLVNVLAPSLPDLRPSIVKLKLQALDSKPSDENRLYMPGINVDVAIVEGDTSAVLEKGAWHRKPQNGNPEKGGNFVLSAHRFELGITPQQTRDKSPFYNIDKVQLGEKIYVDYNKKRYTYEVTKKYKVDRNAIAIEDPSDVAKMTLYSCDLRGEAAGREVIEAKPL